MRPQEIREHLRGQPFLPLRICLSDGTCYDVLHPENAIVSQRQVAIATDLFDDDMPERLVFCDPLHITRIEPMDERQRNGPNKKKKARKKKRR